MNSTMAIPTHGDPIGTIRKVVATVWQQNNLEGIIAPIVTHPLTEAAPRLLTALADLDGVNPFYPLMVSNLVGQLPGIIVSAPQKRLGVLLRPCEMRAYLEVQKKGELDYSNLLTICVDCLGTYSTQDYEWRSERKGLGALSGEQTVQFARQGGIAAYRYRPACQACLNPGAGDAVVNVKVIGLPVRDHILVEILDAQVAQKIRQNGLHPEDATEQQIREHQKALERVIERQKHTFEQLASDLDQRLPKDVDEIIAMLDACGDCDACIQACPICASAPPEKGADWRYTRQSVLRWMASCAGCGMCEQTCPDQLSLNLIFRKVKESLASRPV